MFYSVDGRIVQVDGRFPIFQDNTLTFEVFGDRFPYSSTNSTPKTLIIQSYEPNAAEVNWGDGNVIKYNFNYRGPSQYELRFTTGDEYFYQDLNTGNRFITIKFNKPLSIFMITTLRVNLGPNFPSNIVRFTNLEILNLQQFTGIEKFPENLSSLTKLKEFGIFGGSLSEIPISILNLGLETLIIINSLDLSLPLSETNLDKINLLQNTLKTLILSGGLDQIPQNFAELKIEMFVFNESVFTTLPLTICNITTLKTLSTSIGSNGLTSWNNFEFLPDTIESYSFNLRRETGKLGPDIYDFSHHINLKNISLFNDVMNLQSNVDEFINRVYTIVDRESLKSTGNTKFRQMSIRCTASNNTTSPTGIYQQPAGFVLGSDNGSPASPKEKIWVMVNQYEHTWNYTE